MDAVNGWLLYSALPIRVSIRARISQIQIETKFIQSIRKWSDRRIRDLLQLVGYLARFPISGRGGKSHCTHSMQTVSRRTLGPLSPAICNISAFVQGKFIIYMVWIRFRVGWYWPSMIFLCKNAFRFHRNRIECVRACERERERLHIQNMWLCIRIENGAHSLSEFDQASIHILRYAKSLVIVSLAEYKYISFCCPMLLSLLHKCPSPRYVYLSIVVAVVVLGWTFNTCKLRCIKQYANGSELQRISQPNGIWPCIVFVFCTCNCRLGIVLTPWRNRLVRYTASRIERHIICVGCLFCVVAFSSFSVEFSKFPKNEACTVYSATQPIS